MSAEYEAKRVKESKSTSILGTLVDFHKIMRPLMGNHHFWNVCTLVAYGFGVASVVLVKTEQILCTVGFSDQFSGILTSIFTLSGLTWFFVNGILMAYKRRPLVYTSMNLIMACAGLIAIIAQTEYHAALTSMQRKIVMGVTYVITGIGVMGPYPLLTEMVVEATFPIPETIPLALVTITAQIYSIFFVATENFLSVKIEIHDLPDHQVCMKTDTGGDDFNVEPRRYTTYFTVLLAMGMIQMFLYMSFFRPSFARQSLEDTENHVDNQVGNYEK